MVMLTVNSYLRGHRYLFIFFVVLGPQLIWTLKSILDGDIFAVFWKLSFGLFIEKSSQAVSQLINTPVTLVDNMPI